MFQRVGDDNQVRFQARGGPVQGRGGNDGFFAVETAFRAAAVGNAILSRTARVQGMTGI
jgi:hypothetical protein